MQNVMKLEELEGLFNPQTKIDTVFEEYRKDRASIYFCDCENNILTADEKHKTSYIILQHTKTSGEDWAVNIQKRDNVLVSVGENNAFEFESDVDGEVYLFRFYTETPANIF